jgi:hypothetical protein
MLTKWLIANGKRNWKLYYPLLQKPSPREKGDPEKEKMIALIEGRYG